MILKLNILIQIFHLCIIHINKNKDMIDILNKYGADKNIKTLKGYKPDDL